MSLPTSATGLVTGARPLVERDGEVAELGNALQDACAGRGSVARIEGGYGLGKSRLLAMASRMGASLGMQTLDATGRGLERELAHGLVLQLFEARVLGAPAGERRRLLQGGARPAGLLFDGRPSGEPLDAKRPDSTLHGLFRLCVNLAAAQPLVLAVDDGRLGDEVSLRFLAYLANRIRDLPAVLLITASPDVAPDEPDPLRAIAPPRVTRRLRLRPLSPAATKRHVRGSLLPEASEEVCVACHDATAGNPALLSRLVTELGRGGTDSQPGPDSVESLRGAEIAADVLAHLAAIDAAAPRLARAVAVLGPGGDLGHAAQIAALHPVAAERVAGRLAADEILAPAGWLAFVAPIVGTAIYHASQPEQRAAGHLRAARLQDADGAPAEQVAGHLMRAKPSKSSWAVQRLHRAASLAIERGQPAVAVEHLERALLEPPPPGERALTRSALAGAGVLAGQPSAVGRLAEVVEEVADDRERGAMRLAQGRLLWQQARPVAAGRVLARGLAELDGSDPVLDAQLSVAHRIVSLARGDAPDEGRRERLPTVDAPDEGAVTDAGARARLAAAAGEGTARGASSGEVVALVRRALDGGALLEDEGASGLAHQVAIAALIVAEDLLTAELALTAALEHARARGSTLDIATASHLRGLAILRRGRIDDTEVEARRVLGCAGGWSAHVGGARVLLAHCALERGDAETAREELELARTALALAEGEEGPASRLGRVFVTAGMGRLHAEEGDHAAALEEHLECGRELAELGVPVCGLSPWRVEAAQAAAMLSDLEQAERLLAEELELARAFGAPGAIGRALNRRGRIGGADGEDLFAEAVQTLTGSQLVLERARAQVDLGALLRRTARRGESLELLQTGFDLAERCGATALAARARDETVAAGCRPRRSALSGPDSLTPRERQTAVLAAQGLSNRAIAERLVVTLKTVEWHLRHCYDKLSVRSRTELRSVLGDREDPPG